MRECIKQFVKIVAETLPISEPIYEFGSLQVPGQEDFADLRPLFPKKQYVGCDIVKGPGVDRILNLHHIELPSESVGTVLILETLEHVEFFRKALEEAQRILQPNGLLVISSAMNFPIHKHPHDYWRFTPEGFESLLKPFAFSFVGSVGDVRFPHIVVGLGFKGPISNDSLGEFMRRFEEWKRYWDSIWEEGVAISRRLDTIDLGNQLAEKERRILELQQEFDERTAWALQLNSELVERDRTILQLQREFDERTAWALQLDSELTQLRGELAQLTRAWYYRLLGPQKMKRFREMLRRLWRRSISNS